MNALCRVDRPAVPAWVLVTLLCAGCGTDGGDADANPSERLERLRLETALGDIELELYPGKAPLTVANFLRYVDGGFYDGAGFYRVVRLDNQAQSDVKIEVIQGGMGIDTYDAERAPPFPPVPHETTRDTGLAHLDGTLSMARLAPGSATSEFFICVGPQPSLDFGGARNPDGQGFAAFGRVTAGMDVVRAIQAGTTASGAPSQLTAVAGQLLEEGIRITRAERLAAQPPAGQTTP